MNGRNMDMNELFFLIDTSIRNRLVMLLLPFVLFSGMINTFLSVKVWPKTLITFCGFYSISSVMD